MNNNSIKNIILHCNKYEKSKTQINNNLTVDDILIDILKKKQNENLYEALNEIKNNKKKTSHWAWWAFPTNKTGKSESNPKTYLTKTAAKKYLNNYPIIWKNLLEEINKVIKENNKKIFPRIDNGRIEFFIEFFKEIIKNNNNEPEWLSEILKTLEDNKGIYY